MGTLPRKDSHGSGSLDPCKSPASQLQTDESTPTTCFSTCVARPQRPFSQRPSWGVSQDGCLGEQHGAAFASHAAAELSGEWFRARHPPKERALHHGIPRSSVVETEPPCRGSAVVEQRSCWGLCFRKACSKVIPPPLIEQKNSPTQHH